MRLTLAVALALFPLSLAAQPALPPGVSEFTLANGLQVVVIEDHRAPAVTNMIWYKVGAADEPPGKSGIAHFLEHLMFKGTDTLAAGEFSATVEAQGGSDNAFTSWDYTAYHQRIAADRLDIVLRMEADRMVNLNMTDDDVATERQVVLEERSQRTDSDPGALFGEQRRAVQYLAHPYRIPVIGWRHEIEKLNRDDAFATYRRFYAPNNAVLVVAGDVTPDAVRALAETHFGPIPPSADLPPRERPSEPPQLAARRVLMADERVAQPYLVRTWLAPHRDADAQTEAAALTYLAELLGGSGTTSVLARSLQFDRQIAVWTQAFYDGMALDQGTFGVALAPVPGVSLAEAEAALDEVLARFITDGIDPEAFARVKTQLRASEIYALDSSRGRANRIGTALTTGLTLADVAAWPDILQNVTPEDVMAAAAAVLDDRRSVTGWLQRQEEAAK